MAEDKTLNPTPLQTPFSNWKIVKKDPVMYKDQNSRGLEFVFGMIRQAANPEMDSPLNKNVAVYQKMGENGDYVVVSRAANNENDIRIFEITNETYGDIGSENNSMEFLKRVIEMADGSGMIRNRKQYGEFGDSSGNNGVILEFGGIFDNFLGMMGKKKLPEATDSVNKAILDAGGKQAKALEQATATVSQQIENKPSQFEQIAQKYGAATRGAIAAGGSAAIGTIAKTSADSSVHNANPLQTIGAGVKGFVKGLAGQAGQDKKVADIQAKQASTIAVKAADYEMKTEFMKQKHGLQTDLMDRQLGFKQWETEKKTGMQKETTQMKTGAQLEATKMKAGVDQYKANVKAGALPTDVLGQKLAAQHITDTFQTGQLNYTGPMPANFSKKPSTPVNKSYGSGSTTGAPKQAYSNPFSGGTPEPAAPAVNYGATSLMAGNKKVGTAKMSPAPAPTMSAGKPKKSGSGFYNK